MLSLAKVIFYFGLFTSYNAYAQVIDSKICDGANRASITQYVCLLKTKEFIPLDSVLSSRYKDRFLQVENKPVIFSGYDSYHYWFRIIIKNQESYPKDLMLLLGPLGMRSGQLFQKENKKWKLAGITGYKHSFDKRSYQYAHYVFPLKIPAYTVDTVYLNMDASHAYKTYGFVLMQPKALKAFENKLYFLFGIVIGLLLLFCILNVYLYFALNDKIHLWYALYIALLFFIVMKNDHLDEQFLNFDSEKAYRMTSIMSMAALSIGVLMHVVQLFLANIHRKSFLFQITRIVKWNLFLCAVVQFIVFYYKADLNTEIIVFTWVDYSTICGILTIVINCIYSIYKKFWAAIIILTGLFGFLTGAAEKLLLIPNFSYMFPPSIFHIGIILETIIISLGFIIRYNRDRNEKERLKHAFEKSLLESKFEIQEQTLKNISQEIHDNIGQVLTLAKLDLAELNFEHIDTLKEQVTDSRKLITKAITDLRNLSKSLNADYVMEMGLHSSIECQLEQIKKFGTYTTSLQLKGEVCKLEPQKELIAFRIYQEVVNNIIKHANANSIIVALDYQFNTLELIVSDNGRGFDIETIHNNGPGAGLGLRNMDNRATLIGAAFNIVSSHNGTTVTLRLPILN